MALCPWLAASAAVQVHSLAALHARGERIRSHRTAICTLFFGALPVTGAFTLMPWRIMGRVVLGATRGGIRSIPD